MIDFRDVDTIINHGLAFLRVGGMVFSLPILGDQPTPVPARVLLAAALTASIAHMIPAAPVISQNADVLLLAAMVVKELVIGIAIGYLARVTFDGLLMAASITGYQMGFGTASLFLPDAGQQMDTFTSFHRVIIMTIFLMLNLHHLYIDALITTFNIIPLGKVSISGHRKCVQGGPSAGCPSSDCAHVHTGRTWPCGPRRPPTQRLHHQLSGEFRRWALCLCRDAAVFSGVDELPLYGHERSVHECNQVNETRLKTKN